MDSFTVCVGPVEGVSSESALFTEIKMILRDSYITILLITFANSLDPCRSGPT